MEKYERYAELSEVQAQHLATVINWWAIGEVYIKRGSLAQS
jgi:hypothetical protein